METPPNQGYAKYGNVRIYPCTGPKRNNLRIAGNTGKNTTRRHFFIFQSQVNPEILIILLYYVSPGTETGRASDLKGSAQNPEASAHGAWRSRKEGGDRRFPLLPLKKKKKLLLPLKIT